jgi:hypothetical protein
VKITQLTGEMTGKTIGVYAPDGSWTITGTLWGFKFSAEAISETRLSQEGETFIPGSRMVTVQIGPWSSMALPADTEFTVRTDQ